jgi:hypothetical protein
LVRSRHQNRLLCQRRLSILRAPLWSSIDWTCQERRSDKATQELAVALRVKHRPTAVVPRQIEAAICIDQEIEEARVTANGHDGRIAMVVPCTIGADQSRLATGGGRRRIDGQRTRRPG